MDRFDCIYILSLICFARMDFSDLSSMSHLKGNPEMRDATRSPFQAKHLSDYDYQGFAKMTSL
jgi:hypothetical protein